MIERRLQEQNCASRSAGKDHADEASREQARTAAKHSSLLANLAEADHLQIIAAAQEKKYPRRQTLFLEGDPVRNVILLTSGYAKLMQFGQSGTEVILRLSGPGEVVGAVGLSGQVRHDAMARSVDAVSALVWESSTFESLSDRYPMLRRNTTRILCQRLQEMEQRYLEISTEKVAARLSHELIRLHSQIGRSVNGNGTKEIGLSREELAQMTGTTLFTISRLLSEWDQLGIVRTRRAAVSILKLCALQGLALEG